MILASCFVPLYSAFTWEQQYKISHITMAVDMQCVTDLLLSVRWQFFSETGYRTTCHFYFIELQKQVNDIPSQHRLSIYLSISCSGSSFRIQKCKSSLPLNAYFCSPLTEVSTESQEGPLHHITYTPSSLRIWAFPQKKLITRFNYLFCSITFFLHLIPVILFVLNEIKKNSCIMLFAILNFKTVHSFFWFSSDQSCVFWIRERVLAIQWIIILLVNLE